VGQDVTEHWIEVTYFKRNGTFYTSHGFYATRAATRGTVVTVMQEYANAKTLPGLTYGASGYHVYIHEGPEGHPMSGCPHLIPANPVNKEDLTIEPVH
jgi:hypothetical protein